MKLRTVARTQGNVRALKDGTVTPRHYDLEFVEVPVLIDAFRSMVRHLEYDICEMAMASYICARAHGTRFTALPVFVMRGLHHGAIVSATTSGVASPEDLEGKRVGVNRGYTVTTGVWARGILEEEYGVDPSRVTWVCSGDEHVAEYRPPPSVVAIEEGRDLVDMLLTGELAAAVGGVPAHPDLAPLIPDPEEAAFAALRSQGLYPMNHLVVVRDELLDAEPGLAEAVFDAFAAAKRVYLEELRTAGTEELGPAELMHRRIKDVLGDPFPYGIEPNRPMIEKLVAHCVSQRIIERPITVEDLFAPATHGLIG